MDGGAGDGPCGGVGESPARRPMKDIHGGRTIESASFLEATRPDRIGTIFLLEWNPGCMGTRAERGTLAVEGAVF